MKLAESIQPLVSVIVVTYNQEAYIGQALESILTQQCDFDFEVLVGEDCSTDHTREICLEYQEKYPDKVILCLNEKNKGLLDNYFDVFLKCRGEFIADCGGDDFWMTTHKLQSQVDLLRKHPNVSLVASNWDILYQKTGLLKTGTSHVTDDFFQPDCFGIKAVCSYLNGPEIPRVVLSSSCFRKDLALEAYHQNPEFFRSGEVYCEDISLTLCLLMRGPFYFQKETYMVYRVLEKSLSHSRSMDTYMSGFAFDSYKQFVWLALNLGAKGTDIQPYVQKWAGNFSLYAFLTGNRKLFGDLSFFLKGKNLNLSLKHRLMKVLMYFPGLYQLSKALYTKWKPSATK